MRKKLIAALSGTVAFSLVACGGSADRGTTATGETTAVAGETLTGTAKGYGGDVIVTLTRSEGVITGCTIEGASETVGIGADALPELEKQVVEAGGFEIDGVSGATVTSKAVMKAVAAALGEEFVEETRGEAAVETAAPAELVEIDGGLQIGLAYGAAHGTKCFTEAYAVVQDDMIVAAYLDEFQFLDSSEDVKGVPNSDTEFAKGYAEGSVLCSKRDNAEYYSELMKSKGGSTIHIDVNYDAIQSFVAGKTISEVERAAGEENAVDAVSGATLVDTAGYLKVIAQAAKNAQNTQAVEFSGDSENLKLSVVYGAAHGAKCFTAAAALTDDDTIVLSYLDEFQFLNPDEGVIGVPNSDKDFAQGYAEGGVLCSKRENTEYYSELMASSGGSTVAINDNYDAVQNHVNGMSIAEVEALMGRSDVVDAISGATLVDTAGYIRTIAEAAKKQ